MPNSKSSAQGAAQTALDNFFEDCPGDNPTPTPDNPTPTPGSDFDAECSVELCAMNDTLKANCIREIEACIDAGRLETEQCITFGVETCTI